MSSLIYPTNLFNSLLYKLSLNLRLTVIILMTNRTWFILQIEWTLADMEEDRDSDSDDEIEYSGMIQPPLIKQLRTILSEYPDDGQILKV